VHVVDLHEAEPRAIESLVPLTGARVLEVGCGDGRLTAFAAARATSVYAFDPKADEVAAARAALSGAEARRVRFGVHAAEALDVERESFDLALCGWSL
jgi:ubiquinone/menaquinone biosynthesis C-methylase UbiE